MPLETLFGRLHPMVVHFPIVCLLLVPLFEWVALLRRGPSVGPATRGLLIIGALGTIAAVLTGLEFANETTFEDERAALLDRHKISAFTALCAAIAAIVAGELYRRAPSRAKRMAYLVLVHVAALSVAIGADAGGLLHWGSDFLPR